MKSYIFLENIKIYAHHGVMQQENCVGNYYIVNIKLTLDLSKAAVSDDVSDTVSYADVFEVICREMKISSKLLEHVAARIMFSLKNEFSLIDEVEIKLSKLNPPIGGQVDAASIVLIG